jgi:hypothetical protein
MYGYHRRLTMIPGALQQHRGSMARWKRRRRTMRPTARPTRTPTPVSITIGSTTAPVTATSTPTAVPVTCCGVNPFDRTTAGPHGPVIG